MKLVLLRSSGSGSHNVRRDGFISTSVIYNKHNITWFIFILMFAKRTNEKFIWRTYNTFTCISILRMKCHFRGCRTWIIIWNNIFFGMDSRSSQRMVVCLIIYCNFLQLFHFINNFTFFVRYFIQPSEIHFGSIFFFFVECSSASESKQILFHNLISVE